MNQIQVINYIPPLYRYLEKQYVDLFFDKKILRVSSFEHFKKHKDEARLDTNEGVANLIGKCSDSNMRVEMKFGVSNSFVLCMSAIKSKSICDMFNVDSCFEIFDVVNFSIIIADALIKKNYIVPQILFGFCSYRDTRELHSSIKQENIDEIKIDDKKHTMDFNALFSLGNKMSMPDIYFLKSNNYIEQHEYRIIWNIYNEKIPDFIDLYIPDIDKVCRKINSI